MQAHLSQRVKALTEKQLARLKHATQGYGNQKRFIEEYNLSMSQQTLRNIIARGSGAEEYVDQIINALK